MRALSPALTFSPASFPQATDAAAQRVRALRDELSSLLRREPVDAELATVEPLLASHDAAEVAAAALRLLGRARQALARTEHVDRTANTAAAPRAAPVPATPEQTWTRLFLNVGERDGVRRGDLVGAITGEASIPGSQIGKITLHETYSLVEVASPVAEQVVERLTGVSIRGRRVSPRPDRAGARGAPADARRGGRRDASDTAQGSRGGPRAAREHEEWSSRGERLRHARRPTAEPPGSEP
jgi:ATP-dependent RNA helicase DeaD